MILERDFENVKGPAMRHISRRWLTALASALALGILAFSFRTRGPASEHEQLAHAILASDKNSAWEWFAESIDSILSLAGIPLSLDEPKISYRDLAMRIAERDGQRAIPILIGVIDADNSIDTVYQLGYVSLQSLTGVPYSPFHDGPWWRRWWEANRERFPDEVQKLAIPHFAKTKHGEAYVPFPPDTDTLQGKLRLCELLVRFPRNGALSGVIPRIDVRQFAEQVADHKDPHALPYLIGMAEADPYIRLQIQSSLRQLAGIEPDFTPVGGGKGEYKDPMTGIHYQNRQTEAGWWRDWWEKNRGRFPGEVGEIEIPDFSKPLEFHWREKP